MHQRKPAAREKPDTGPYTIHRGQLPTAMEVLGREWLVASFDPATDNFAYRVERRGPTAITTETMGKVKFNREPDEQGNCTLYSELEGFLRLLPHLPHLRLVVIERQMSINTNAVRMAQHLIAFFMGLGITNLCIVELNSQVKSRALGAPKGLNATYLKKWDIWSAEDLLSRRGDNYGLQLFRSVGKKLDDVADVVIQIEALCTILGLPLTPEWSTQPTLKLVQ